MDRDERNYTEGTPEIIIEQVGGTLQVKGWDQPTVEVKSHGGSTYTMVYEQNRGQNEGHEDDVETDEGIEASERAETGKNINLQDMPDDCDIRVPRQARLRIGEIGGDCVIKAVDGQIHIGTVGSSLDLRHVQDATIESIGGDLWSKHGQGHLRVESIGGTASVGNHHGTFTGNDIGGDLRLKSVHGSVTAHAGGSAKLELEPEPGQSYQVTAGADMICRIPVEANVAVTLDSGSEQIRIKNLAIPASDNASPHNFVLGDGSAELSLSSGGNMILIGREQGESRGWQHGHHHDHDFDFNMSFDIDLDKWIGERTAQLSERMQRKVQQAVEQAEKQIAGAMRNVERQIHRAERRAQRMDEHTERRARRMHESRGNRQRSRRQKWAVHESVTPPTSPTPPTPPTPPVSDEERMMILRMVEEGKIDVDQAEKLLEALHS